MTNPLSRYMRISSPGQQGAALVMALLSMLVVSIIVIGYSTDVDMDIMISRNLQLKNQAFNWAETGTDIAQELVAYSVDTRGDAPLDTSQGATSPISFNNNYEAVAVTFDEVQDEDVAEENWDYYPLHLSEDGLIYICDVSSASDPTRKSDTRISFKGSKAGEGGSIIIAAGYEGVGKGAGAAGGFQSFFQIESQGYDKHNSCQSVGAMYRHVLR